MIKASGAVAFSALVLFAAPGPALAGQAIATVGAPTPISAFGGRLAWSAFDPAQRSYRLMTEAGGTISAVPVAPRGVPFDVDLGPDQDGATIAVYSRCKHEPLGRDPAISNAVAQLPGWSSARGCDLYRFDFASGREIKIASATTRGASEFLPTVWKTRIAFARVYERRKGRAGERAYLYSRSLTGRGRAQRLPVGARSKERFCTGKPRRCRIKLEPGPTALDLAGRRLAFGWDSGDAGPTSAVYLDTIRSKRADKRLVSRVVSGDIQAEEILSPQIADGQVVWALTLFGDQTSSISQRFRIADGGLSEAPLQTADPADAFIRPVIAAALDGRRVPYLASGLTPNGEPCTPQNRCIADPGCSAAQPCELRSAENLSYAPVPKRRSRPRLDRGFGRGCRRS
jgi:hypothetical protein